MAVRVTVRRLYLVRHGRAAAGWDADVDPPIDALGRQQAHATAVHLAPRGPLPVVSSPLARCRQTAAVIADEWDVDIRIEPGVTEIPSPAGVPMADRVEWLRAAMASTWASLGEPYIGFRDGVVATLCALHTDTVVVSHFIALNAVIGAALGDDRVVIHRLDNASVTVVDIDDDDRIHLVEVGREADTLIR